MQNAYEAAAHTLAAIQDLSDQQLVNVPVYQLRLLAEATVAEESGQPCADCPAGKPTPKTAPEENQIPDLIKFKPTKGK